MPKTLKTEEIKVRVEPSKKRAMAEIAAREALDLSDIARRAFQEYLDRHTNSELRRAA